MAINKVIVNGETKLDLTADTATADKVLKGFTFHDATGELKTGTNEGGINGYYIKKVFEHSDVYSYTSIHVDVTTEGRYGFFYVEDDLSNSNQGGASFKMQEWYNDSEYNNASTLYIISNKPVTDISYYENSSSSSSSY